MIKALLIKGAKENLKYLDNDIKQIEECFKEIGIITVSVEGDKHSILPKLNEIIDGLGTTDTLIIYYTGHAYLNKNRVVLKLLSGEKSSFILSINEIMDNIADANINSTVFILDCCFAKATEAPWKTYSESNNHLFLPSDKLEKAEELEEFKASFFTHCICSALKSKSSELYTNNRLTLDNLYKATRLFAIEYNKKNNSTKPIPELLGARGKEVVLSNYSPERETKLLETTIEEYLNSYINCIEKCDGSCSDQKEWCDTIFKSDANMNKYVIPIVREFISNYSTAKKEKLDCFIEHWIYDSNTYMGLLGEMGVGKTTACIYIFFYLAKKYITGKSSLIPVYFPLSAFNKYYLKDATVYSAINKLMSCKLTDQDMERICKDKRLVLILDGFDEISGDSSIASILHNYENLKPFMRLCCKTILTCRTHYFSEQEQLEEVLTGKSEGTDFATTVLNDEYPFSIVELQEFSEEEILELIALLSPDGDNKQIWREISEIYDLKDLSKRALLLKMIVNTLPDLQKSSSKVDSSSIYLKYTQRLLRREVEKRQIGLDISEKENFIGYIANLMFISNELTIETHKFDKEIKDYFSASCYTKDELNSCNYDCKVSTFFTRDKKDNYRFMHKSFFEFYFALYCIKQLGEDNLNPWKIKWFPKEIACFIKELLSNKKYMHLVSKLVQISLDETDEILLWNSLHIISLIEKEIMEKHFTEKIKYEYMEKGKKATKTVVIRQYCRIIAKFIDENLAKNLIDKIIEIVRSNSLEDNDNNNTYYNYYGGKKSACQAFIKHLSVLKPKYDAKLHLYLLESFATVEFADKLLDATSSWECLHEYDAEILCAVEKIRNREALNAS